MEKDLTKQRAISLLSEEIVKNRLVVFIGAGCSVSAGLPSWKELIYDLLKQYNIETKDTDLLRLATRLERDVGKLKLRESIAERLQTRPDTESLLHDNLARLSINLFITTNYDHLLEDTFRKNGFSPVIISKDKDLSSIDPGKKTIAKLHGDMDSASSMVISKPDYTRYKSSHKVFVEWLNAVMAQNTVLFLGTSFDDPRLNDADDHILGLFGDFRRQPFILLKTPQKDDSTIEDDFEIDLADFEARCEDFRDRGFFVVAIDTYDEIPGFLQGAQKKALERKRKNDLSGFDSRHILQADHLAALEKNMRDLLDDKTLQLSEYVLGKGRRPTFLVMAERAEKLIDHLENPPGTLSPEAQMEGNLTLADAFLSSSKQEHIALARQYYERANAAYDKSNHKIKWEDRLLRVRAKTLFFEGKTDEAIESIAHSENPKTVSLWLAVLIDTGRFEKAYEYVSQNPKRNPLWVCEALSVLIETGRIQEAEKVYTETLDEYSDLKGKGELKGSGFSGESFYEKLHFHMAHAFFYRAIRLAGKPEFSTIYPGQLTQEGESLCGKALFYIDRLFEQASRKNISENYLASLALGIEMSAAYFLGDVNRADKAAKDLLSVRPLMREVSRYVLIRATHFDHATLEDISNYLTHDYHDSWWAFEMVAFLEGVHLKNNEASWAALKKAVALVASREEKEKVARAALDLGFELGLQDESLAIVYALLETGNDLRRLLEAKYQYRIGNTVKADESFANLEKKTFPPDISSEIKFFRGQFAIEKKEWGKARESLEASIKLAPSPIAMKDLLRVYMQLQDNAKALEMAEEIEKVGEDDELVIHAKAWAARNLGHFQISEEAWQRLKEYGQKPEYAYGLAEVMFLRGNPSKALQALKRFIQCNDETDPACLSLACSIHESGDEFPEAFRLLHNCYDKIQNNPQLLMKYMELGYRVDKEREAHEAFMRIEALRQEGKVPEKAFVRMDLNQVLEMFRQRRKTAKKINDLYRLGRFPRLMVCDHKNMPLYLDWAVRTQPLLLPDDSGEWINFTTYATNSMRIERVKERNQLAIITAPPDATEIVIDYHALITVHRLGLIDTIQERYGKIYYPYVLEIIWANDQRRFGHHQLSKEKVYRVLNERLTANQINEMTAPMPFETVDKEKDTPTKRNLRLARLEKMLVIDAFVKEKDLADFDDITVIRLLQVVDWLYAKGKIGEDRLRELKTVCSGEPETVKADSHKLIEVAPRFLVSETTLELMEQYDLNQHVLGLGKQIVIEYDTARYIRQAVLEVDFGKEVGKWHRDLSKAVRDSNVFESVHPDIDPKDRILLDTPYYEGSVSAITYAAKAGLFLLTDDRMTQMIREKEWANRQFGTDALLTDLFENGKITIDKYANGFLQLCRWRYRFLLPDVRILVFLARQYKKKPLGKPLNEIATYGRQCMEDTGLFLGPELTVPTLPLGIKFQMAWVERWMAFLVDVWQDDDFTPENLEQITRKVYEQALPGPPKGLKDEIRESYSGHEDKFIVGKLFILASEADTPEKLHGLFSQTFRKLGYDEKRQEEGFKEHLERLSELPGIDIRTIGRGIAIRIIMAIYGKRESYPVPSLLHPIMQKFGLLNEGQDTIQAPEGKEEVGGRRFDDLADLIVAQQRLPEYKTDRPFIKVPPAPKKPGLTLVPHELIQAASAKLRIAALTDILKHGEVSEFTKIVVRKKAENTKSNKAAIWRPAAAEVADAVLKDFLYARSLFVKAMPLTPPRQDWIDAAWSNLLRTNLDSVWSEVPGIISKRWSEKILREKLYEALESEKNKEDKKRTNSISQALDWYMIHVGFVPFCPPYDSWSIINKVLGIGRNSEMAIKTDRSGLWPEVQEWIKDKQDPVAYIIALQMVFNERRLARNEQKHLFSSKEFFDFLNDILTVLIRPEDRTGDTKKDLKLKWIQAGWDIRVLLARHYLSYIDLQFQDSMDDEKRVLTAWWMAREVTSALADSMKHLTREDQITAMERDATQAIEKMSEPTMITHSFSKTERPLSPARFCTVSVDALPTCATLGMLMPGQPDDPDVCNCFAGMIKPTNALSTEIRNAIIEKLRTQLPSGLGQLNSEGNRDPRLLWDIPLCISAPAFLKEYYGNKIEYLGQEKMSVFHLAREIAEPGFLDEELPLLPKRIKHNEGSIAAVVLAALYVYLCTHGKMPEGAKVFDNNLMLARDISRLKDPFNWHCLVRLITILGQLQSWRDFKWAGIISKLFRHVDYSGISESSAIQAVVSGIISMVLLGVDYALLRPILVMSTSDKKVRNALGQVKPLLTYTFSKLPGSHREIARKILSDLEDIPIPEKLTDISGVNDDT